MLSHSQLHLTNNNLKTTKHLPLSYHLFFLSLNLVILLFRASKWFSLFWISNIIAGYSFWNGPTPFGIFHTILLGLVLFWFNSQLLESRIATATSECGCSYQCRQTTTFFEGTKQFSPKQSSLSYHIRKKYFISWRKKKIYSWGYQSTN